MTVPRMMRRSPKPKVFRGSAASIGNRVGRPVTARLYASISSAGGRNPTTIQPARRSARDAAIPTPSVPRAHTSTKTPNGIPHSSASNGRLRKIRPSNPPPTTNHDARPDRAPRRSAVPAKHPSASVNR